MNSEILLKEIQDLISRKQMFSAKGISIDTLLLVLHIKEDELMPLLNDLITQGVIEHRVAPSSQSQRSKLLGTIHLVENNK